MAMHRSHARSAVRTTIGALGLSLMIAGAVRAERTQLTATPTPRPNATPSPEVVRCSDVDGDGDVSVTDGVLVLRAAAELATPCIPATCDADGDGTLTVSDGVRVLGIAADLNWSWPACPPFVVEEDFSAFTRFEFERQGALGFCPPTGSVFRATIERLGEASYRASLSVLEEGDPADPGCIPSVDTCFVARELPERLLSDAEIATVRSAFAAMPLARSPDPICVVGGHYDPCVINSAVWDGLQATDFSCHVPRLLGEHVQALSALLDGLAIPGVP